MAFVVVGYLGEEGEMAAVEPCEVYLQWLRRSCICEDIKVLDLSLTVW